MTNADVIRNMTDCELAQFLELVKNGCDPRMVWKARGFGWCRKWSEWNEWLKTENKPVRFSVGGAGND